MNIASLILAAGKGTRMKSKLPKVLHKVGGKAMVERVLETVQSIGTNRDVVIVGFGGDAVQNYLGERAEFVRQEEQNGTGHAVKMAQPVLGDYDGTIVLLSLISLYHFKYSLRHYLAHRSILNINHYISL